jgi:hypothetical protein
MNQSASIDLGNVDVHVLFDKSGSMSENDTPTRKSRWEYSKEFVAGLVTDLGQYDEDGIDITIFDTNFATSNGVTADAVFEVFKKYRPQNGTVLAPPLKAALNLARSRWSDKKQLIIVVTDGQPSDADQVAKVIIEATQAMDRDSQCAISFMQVGTDAQATRFLQELDDALQGQGAKFDIVDTGRLEDLAGMTTQDFVDKTFND